MVKLIQGNRRRLRAWGIALLAFALVCAVGILFVRAKGTPSSETPTAVPVKTMPAETGRVEKTVRLVGVLAPSHAVPVASKTGGKIEKIQVATGDQVRKGDLLVLLESREIRAQARQAAAAADAARANLARLEKGATPEEIKQLEAAVAQAEAAHAGAKSAFDRMKALLDVGAVSRQQFEQAEVQFKVAAAQLAQATERLAAVRAGAGAEALEAARAQLRQAEAAAELAQAALANVELRAPMAGMVSEVTGEPGQLVGPGTPVVILVVPDPLQVELNLPENLIGQLQAGSEVAVGIPVSGAKVTGRVKTVSPAASIQSRLFKAKIEVPNPDGTLKAGMFAEVYLVEQAAEGCVIPQEAIVTSSAGSKVFVVENEVARERPVQILAHDGERVAVEGITPGQTVVVSGQEQLRDNTPVRVVGEGR